MTRPTREDVAIALTLVRDAEGIIEAGSPLSVAHESARVLAAEVLALRVELAEARRNVDLFREASEAAELRIVELRKERDTLHKACGELSLALERVEAQLHGYEAFVHSAADLPSKVADAYETVIGEMRAALRGDQ